MKAKPKADWDKLREEYDAIKERKSYTMQELREFCVRKAQELKISYGQFVHWLRR